MVVLIFFIIVIIPVIMVVAGLAINILEIIGLGMLSPVVLIVAVLSIPAIFFYEHIEDAIDSFKKSQEGPKSPAHEESSDLSETRYEHIRQRKEYVQLKREQLIAQKSKHYFQKWKSEQYRCQDGKCAWCKKDISASLTLDGTNIDHIRPLWHFGTNEYRNLVLSCNNCNKLKRASTKGYGTDGDTFSYNRSPNWIKRNRYSVWDSELDDMTTSDPQ